MKRVNDAALRAIVTEAVDSAPRKPISGTAALLRREIEAVMKAFTLEVTEEAPHRGVTLNSKFKARLRASSSHIGERLISLIDSEASTMFDPVNAELDRINDEAR